MANTRARTTTRTTARTVRSIDLLRHGETEGGTRFNGSTDVALTTRGWEQLGAAVQGAERRWDRLLSSPLCRCADFARQLACDLDVPLHVDERFREMHFGAWEGRSAAELMETGAEALGAFWADPKTNTPPEAEALSDFEARVLSAWHEVIHRYPGEALLLVTHGGVIRTILCHVQDRPIERLLEQQVAHASLRRVKVNGDEAELRYALEEVSPI